MAAGPVGAGTSVFQTAPADPRAVTVVGKGDGRADDTDAIQRALDVSGGSPLAGKRAGACTLGAPSERAAEIATAPEMLVEVLFMTPD